MSILRKHRLQIASIIVIWLMISGNIKSQDLQFSLYADPLIGWFSSDTRETVNEGARPGFSLGLIFDTYFADNYAFSTGISMMNVSGRVSYSDTTTIRFKNSTTELNPEETITYKVQYLSIPVGLKLRTNEIGYMTLFTNVGLDPRIVIGGRAHIPSQDIEKEDITEELKKFNLGFHITIGTEYSLGGTTALVFGLRYENNFIDVTKDFDDQPEDKLTLHIIRFRMGINF